MQGSVRGGAELTLSSSDEDDSMLGDDKNSNSGIIL